MPVKWLDNFRATLQTAAAYTSLRKVGASDMRNFTVSDDGWLTPRGGSSRKNAAASELGSTNPVGVVYTYNYTPATNFEFLIAVSDKVYYWDGTQFSPVTNTPTFANASEVHAVSAASLAGTKDDTRLFLSVLDSTAKPYWLDLQNNPAATAPILYRHGIETPGSAPTCAAGAAGGSLTNGKHVRYKYSYYNAEYGIESEPSAMSADFTITATGKVDVTMAQSTNDITVGGKQVDTIRIYRTQEGAAALPDTEPVYYLASVSNTPGGGNTTYTDDGSVALSTAITPHTDDDDIPAWRHICWHANRLWMAEVRGNTLYVTGFDSGGLPTLDRFANPDNVVYVEYNDGDRITGIVRSPRGRQLLVFKTNSVYVVYGDAAMTPSTLDTSQRLEPGCIAPKSIALVDNLVYFLTPDKFVYACNGSDVQQVSFPRYQSLLNDIPDGKMEDCIGINYMNKYLLAFPASGATTNNRLLVWDPEKREAVLHDNWELNDMAWNKGPGSDSIVSNELYGAMADEAYVRQLFTGTQDNGAAFTCAWQTNWFYLPGDDEGVVTGVRVITSAKTEQITARVDTDGTNGTPVSYTPVKSDKYQQGVFSRGERYRVRISSSESPTIERFGIEYETER